MANKKQFGIWMDGSEAVIVGRENITEGNFIVLGKVKSDKVPANSSENAANNQKQASELKFFKEITANMQNAEDIVVTGTGTIQEQFVNYLAETPQFKNATAVTETANKMSDEKVIEYFEEKFGK